jgi:hypothetical protein
MSRKNSTVLLLRQLCAVAMLLIIFPLYYYILDVEQFLCHIIPSSEMGYQNKSTQHIFLFVCKISVCIYCLFISAH